TATVLSGGCATSHKTAPVAAQAAPARQDPAPEVQRRTVEFEEKSESDVRQHMAQWQEDGWSVLSLSERLPQPDGTIHRQAELSRAKPARSGAGYDDRRIARIKRGETSEAELLEWFGAPESRSLNPDGRSQLSWSFRTISDGDASAGGKLQVSLG